MRGQTSPPALVVDKLHRVVSAAATFQPELG